MRALSKAAQSKPILLNGPIDVPVWKFGSHSASVPPRTDREPPCARAFSWIKTDHSLAAVQRVVQKAWPAFKDPSVLLDNGYERPLCLFLGPFDPVLCQS